MSNIATLKSNEPGKRYAGRKAGVQNMMTRVMKTALMLAAEESKHGDGSLKGYLLHLANERPELFAPMLMRLIPIQAKVETTNVHPSDLVLDASMSLPEMISRFEAKIKDPNYFPRERTIDHEVEDDGE